MVAICEKTATPESTGIPGGATNGRVLFVVNEDDVGNNHTIQKYKLPNMELLEEFEFHPSNGTPAGLDFDGKNLIVFMNNDPGASQGNIHSVSPRSGLSNHVITTLQVPTEGEGDGKNFFVSDILADETYLVNRRTGETLRTFDNPGSVSEFCHFNCGKYLWVGDRNLGYQTLLDRKTGEFLAARMLYENQSRWLKSNGKDFYSGYHDICKEFARDGWLGDFGILDTFTGPDSQQLSDRTPEISVSGTNWFTAGVEHVEWVIDNNEASPAIAAGNDNPILVLTGVSDGFIDTRCRYQGQVAGIFYRYVDSTNYGLVFYEGTNLILAQVISGVYAQLTSRAVSWSVGDEKVLHIEFKGPYIVAGVDGFEYVYTTSGSAALQNGTIHGPFTKLNANTRFDSFRVRK